VIRVCPRCRGLTQDTFLCPRCGVQTHEAENAEGEVAATIAPDPPTVIHGVLIGLLIAQGATYALRHLVSAALLFNQEWGPESAFWATFAGTVTTQTIQAIALLLAAIVAGAGQSRPLFVGVLLGAMNALLFWVFQVVVRQPIEPLMYAQPFFQAAFGTIGSVLGARIWRPAPPPPALAATSGPDEESLSIVLPEESEILLEEPFPWLRFTAATLVAIGGTFGAPWIRDFIVIAAGGTRYEMQSNFITWQIAAFSQIMGGVIAGANSRHGAIYGFWVGILTAAFVIIVPSLADAPAPDVSAWILGGAAVDSRPAALLITGIQLFLFGFLGGWLGALILPAHFGSRGPSLGPR
jgi:hypothetical protein